MNKEVIKNKIYTIRGFQVMLDSILAKLYGVTTSNLNKAVKRNIERFPDDFMFQLTKEEFENLMCQNVTSRYKGSLKCQNGTLEGASLRSQIVTLEKKDSLRFQNGILNTKRGKHKKYLPYVFTEQGVATLSGVLKSKKAVKVNIQIMRAFVAMRQLIAKNQELFIRLGNIETKQIQYDKNFEKIFEIIDKKQIPQNKESFLMDKYLMLILLFQI